MLEQPETRLEAPVVRAQAAESANTEANFRWNFAVNAMDITFYMLAMNLVSQTTIMPLLVSRLTQSKTVIGLIPAIYSVGFLLPQLFLANYSEGLPRKKPFIMLWSSFGERLPYLLIGLALLFLAVPAPGLTLVLFFLLIATSAVAGGVTMPAWYDMIAKVIPLKWRGVWWGTGNSLAALLGIAGAALSGWILATYAFPTNFATCFLLASVAMVFSWVGLALNREPESLAIKERTSQLAYFKRLPSMLRSNHNYRAYLISRSVANLGNMAAGFITVYCVEKFHLGGVEIGGLTAVLVGSQAITNLAWGALADRRGNKLVLCAAAFGMALTILVTGLASSPGWLWVIYSLLGIALSADMIAGMNIILEFCSAEDRPTYIGLTNTLLAPTRSLSPIMGGWIATVAGYSPMFFAAVAFSILGGSLLAVWVKEPRHHGTQLHS